jgi:hypothetical protein
VVLFSVVKRSGGPWARLRVPLQLGPECRTISPCILETTPPLP